MRDRACEQAAIFKVAGSFVLQRRHVSIYMKCTVNVRRLDHVVEERGAVGRSVRICWRLEHECVQREDCFDGLYRASMAGLRFYIIIFIAQMYTVLPKHTARPKAVYCALLFRCIAIMAEFPISQGTLIHIWVYNHHNNSDPIPLYIIPANRTRLTRPDMASRLV